MKRKIIDSQIERQILIGLIVSTPFLSQVAPAIDLDSMEEGHFRLVMEWCLNYFKSYGKAPGRHIESIYYAWADSENKNEDHSEAIKDFLEHLSSEYENQHDINIPYLLDSLSRTTSIERLRHLKDELEYSLSNGEEKRALGAVTAFRTVDFGVGAGIDVLNDRDAWTRAFQGSSEPLLTFQKDAGEFFNPALTRDALIGVQGPEKRGKTWWCVEFVIRALKARKKVALFEVGDLSESQIMIRMGIRMAGLPLWSSQVRDLHVPRLLMKIKSGTDEEEEKKSKKEKYKVEAKYKTIHPPHTINKKSCVRACREYIRNCGIPLKIPYIMASIHPNSSINVAGIEGVLKRWEYERGFIPDVIVIDYADILAPEDPKKQARDQVNDTWKALRRLSQVYHCLVIVPTQANAASYDAEIQSMKNFSEDKRKLAHVTGMLGLNQTESEKEQQIMRLNWIVLRESEFSTNKCLYVGQCLDIGKAFCCGVS